MAGVQKRKIRWAISLFLVMLYFSGLPAQAQYGGGSGEPNDPYLIYTAEQMNAIGANPNGWDKHFRLMADIDLSNYTGTDFNIIGYAVDWDEKPFTGVFDGNGKTISNFSYTSTGAGSIGLFGYVSGENAENAEIKNLGLIEPNVDAGTGDNVGSLVGYLEGGTINNCYVQGGSVLGTTNVGGLVGSNLCQFGSYEGVVSVGTIINCYSTGSVSGNYNVGGLVGKNLAWYGSYELGVGSIGTIINCYSTGSVSGNYNVGGLVGQNGTPADFEDPGGAITNCYSTGGVDGGEKVGGLVGGNWGTITNCYSTGSVSGYWIVGGLVGLNYGTITNCYSAGGVTGSIPVGGLVGDNAEGTITNSFWDTQTSGQYNMCGDTGPEGSGCDNTNGKTTAEMKMASTFTNTGWDFAGQPDGPHDIWVEPVGGGYPILWWQLSPLPELPSFSGGAGESNDPYLISTSEDLNSIGHNPRLMTAHFRLVNDIDLAGVDFFIIGNELLPFAGVFDGSGHAISNFTYDSNDTYYYIGLFGTVRGENALVKDLGLIDPNVDAGTVWGVGSLVGYVGNGTIANCYIEGGSVSGDFSVGGLAGASCGTITNCYATCSVLCSDTEAVPWSGVGGLVGGIHYGGTISNCYSTGSVSGIAWDVGGLVGENVDGTITNCYSTGTVSGDWTVGGLVANNWDTIIGCYSTGRVLGTANVGGLVGDNALGTIADCYATSSVSGFNCVGGLVGNNADWFGDEGTVTHCYSVGAVSGDWDIGGLVGSISDWLGGEGTVTHCFWDTQTSGLPNSAGGTGKTTAEMQMATTFLDADWDFVGKPDGPSDLWAEPASGGYPILWWQLSPLPELPSFSGGTGEPNDPYLISTGEDLNSIGHNPRLMASHFKLINDIDLTGVDFFIIGNDPFPFAGVFDGSGHVISNFTYDSNDTYDIGLFGSVRGENALIKDLGLIDPNVDAGTDWGVGSLVGSVISGTINNCYVQGGSVTGTTNVGGLVGDNGGTITNCSAAGGVSGNDYVGGLAGSNGGTITNCYSTGSVSGYWIVGGLVGEIWWDTITNCYSTSHVWGTTDVGGLVGNNDEGTITNCSATGSVTGNEHVGGLVGQNGGGWFVIDLSTISNSYSTGSVSGDANVGGLVGGNPFGTITNCYATGGVSGTTNVGGLVGENTSIFGFSTISNSFWDIETSGQTTSADGTGKTTSEMQMESTFTDAGWDFVAESVNGTEDIWSICEGTNYPRLVWQIPAGDFVCPDGITIEDILFFIEHWRDDECDVSNDYCQGTDLDFSGTVDEADLEILIENWLAGGND